MTLLLPVCAAFMMVALSACSFSASTANISNAKMATDQNGKHPTKVFSPDQTFYCVADLNNAPKDTKVKAVWTAVKVQGAKPNTQIDEASTKSGSGQLQFNLTNNGSWPTGDYKVDLYLNNAKKPTKTLTFKVQ
jgi:outer membrane usher protein FimD/PapC